MQDPNPNSDPDAARNPEVQTQSKCPTSTYVQFCSYSRFEAIRSNIFQNLDESMTKSLPQCSQEIQELLEWRLLWGPGLSVRLALIIHSL